ncbi:cation:proton antiporter domain-containing protein [Congregibacter sp.]|uniref:cation:proton antiporter domain-containing protein n=1 Tax=Congregibacter sp. TaxID=2744308 RepID=UPI003F6D7D01
MDTGSVTFAFFLIFSGAAALASVALYTRQPLIIAYIALGALIGPSGFSLVTDLQQLSDIGHIGIIFLLFLLGLDMQPQALFATIRNSTVVGLVSSAIFFLTSWVLASFFFSDYGESVIVAVAMMFSSTIIGIKLLPTTILHHKHIGEMMIGLLLLQDLLAIIVLVLIMASGSAEEGEAAWHIAKVLVALPLLGLAAWAVVRYVLLRLIQRFDRFHEYIFLLAIGWCLGMAEAAQLLGLSAEIGAFVAGVSIATSPISQYIAVNLKPLRDFFLILFFFAVGARFDLAMLEQVWLPALCLALLVLAMKPVTYRLLLKGMSERSSLAWDLGFRLGQASEFSLLIAYIAFDAGLLGLEASLTIQATTIITLLVSSYIVVLNYPTPIAISDRLRRD